MTYPAHWEADAVLSDGGTVRIRPISPADADALQAMLVRSGAIDILVIDSVAALVPKAEIEGEMGDSLPGLHARLMFDASLRSAWLISRACSPGS